MTAASRSAACLSLPGMACAYQLSVMLASAWPQSVRENRLRALGRWPCEVARAAVGVYHTGCGAPAYRAASCVDYPASFPRARRVFLYLNAVHLFRPRPTIPITTVKIAQSAKTVFVSIGNTSNHPGNAAQQAKHREGHYTRMPLRGRMRGHGKAPPRRSLPVSSRR